MRNYLYLVFMGMLGLSISVFSFYKGHINLNEVNHFIDGEKSFYEVFVEPKNSPKKQISTEKSYLNIKSYSDFSYACNKLSGAAEFVRNYLADFVNVNAPLRDQVKNIRLLKEYDHFIQAHFEISNVGSSPNLQSYHQENDENSCSISLQTMSDIIYKISSVSSRSKIKQLSTFIESDLENFYEYENIVISYPFVFYFKNGDLFDFRYVTIDESHKAEDYLENT